MLIAELRGMLQVELSVGLLSMWDLDALWDRSDGEGDI